MGFRSGFVISSTSFLFGTHSSLIHMQRRTNDTDANIFLFVFPVSSMHVA